MSPDFRAVIRKFDDSLKQGDEKQALDMALQAVKEMDDHRNYSNSINLLSHLVNKVSSEVTKSNLVSHLILRGLITGDTLKVAEYGAILENCAETSISLIIKNILNSSSNMSENEYVLDGIEKQTIFGKFEPIQEIPHLEFEDENAVYTTIEDYFNDGRYVVNLIQTTSHFHHSVNIDIGNAIDANIVEKHRIMKLG